MPTEPSKRARMDKMLLNKRALIESMNANQRAIDTQIPSEYSFNQLMKELNNGN